MKTAEAIVIAVDTHQVLGSPIVVIKRNPDEAKTENAMWHCPLDVVVVRGREEVAHQ